MGDLEFTSNIGFRDGIPLEKGIVLTTDFIDENIDIIHNYLNFWMLYPDCFLDLITPTDSSVHLFFYQRIALRAAMRYRYHSLTATRATSKSFMAVLSMILRAIFLPNSKLFTCADVKGTAIKVTKQKLDEIWSWWPLLHNELEYEHVGQDYIDLKFKNGSIFTIVSMTSAGRGNRATGGVIEESATIDGDALNEIVIPMMNVNRRGPDGYMDPNESHQAQNYITTAGSKTCFMYQKLIEMTVMSILRPNEYFVWGMDFRVPVYHGLLDKRFLDEQRLSSTYSEQSFARESMSIWTGNSKDSWFDSNQLLRYRKLLKCEREAQKAPSNPDAFYIIGVDVARYQANTAIVVIKVLPNQNGFRQNVVYIEVIHGENFITEQAPRIKKLIDLYKPREVVIDGNGLGAGLLDAMVLPSLDNKTGEMFPPYYTFNNENHLPPVKRATVPQDPQPDPSTNAIIYDLKAGSGNDDLIHSNFFAQVTGGKVAFLANERIVKTKLLATKKGQRMSIYDRRVYLLPYEMTSRLMDEINNLKLKPTGQQNTIKVEQIARSIPKDRFSALEYGLWRVKYYEDKAIRKAKKNRNFKNYTYFSPRDRR